MDDDHRCPAGESGVYFIYRMLKNRLLPRLLKKVHMQGGAQCAEQGVLRVRRSERASAPTPHPLPPRQRGEMLGLFQQPAGS
jgi:hypothetical protein